MENIVISWREALLIGVLVLSVYIVEMLLLLRARGSGDGVLGVFRSNRGEAELRQEVAQLAGRIQQLEQQLLTLQAAHAGTEETPYQRAIQLARQGRDANRISQACGISHGEAELIVSMHGPNAG